MSTKAIHEALDWLENYLDHNPEAQDARRRARKEVEAIENAVTFIATVDTAAEVTPELAARAAEVHDLFERIANERQPKKVASEPHGE